MQMGIEQDARFHVSVLYLTEGKFERCSRRRSLIEKVVGSS